MYTINTTQRRCEAHIAINRSRLKGYENRYYLKDKSNFEIELFNPHTVSVLAKIKMNGEYISSSGLIIKPGQRVFLSRYLDSNNSFLFETYEVESSKESLDAIQNNGKIQVEFYLEQKYQQNFGITWVSSPSPNVYYTNNIGLTSNSGSFSVGNGTFPIAGSLSNGSELKNLSIESSLETGRIEKGGASLQTIESAYGSYNSWVDSTVDIQLLPESAKPVVASEIRTYCTECGTRMKKQTWKFCPNCGTKID